MDFKFKNCKELGEKLDYIEISRAANIYNRKELSDKIMKKDNSTNNQLSYLLDFGNYEEALDNALESSDKDLI